MKFKRHYYDGFSHHVLIVLSLVALEVAGTGYLMTRYADASANLNKCTISENQTTLSAGRLVPLNNYFNNALNGVSYEDHYYTLTRNDTGLAAFGYCFNTVEGYGFPNQVAGTVPLYDYWNGSLRKHYYATAPTGITAGDGYALEPGNTTYVSPTRVAGTEPLYRYVKLSNSANYYTVSPTVEGASAVKNDGYVLQGIAAYVWTGPNAYVAPKVPASTPKASTPAPSGGAAVGSPAPAKTPTPATASGSSTPAKTPTPATSGSTGAIGGGTSTGAPKVISSGAEPSSQSSTSSAPKTTTLQAKIGGVDESCGAASAIYEASFHLVGQRAYRQCQVKKTGLASSLVAVGTRVYDSSGNEFIPYGVSIADDLEGGGWQNVEAASDAQIQAAARYWHVNTIRLQVSENNIMESNATSSQDYNPAAMQRLGAEVNEVESLGKAPIINDNTEFTGNELGPTAKTVAFWQAVTGYLAANNTGNKYSNVIFDVYNEPKTQGSVWQKGGTYEGNTYLGMQDLVNTIRNGSNLSDNLIMVEGPSLYTGGGLDLLDQYPISGSNLLFAYHHVHMDNPGSWPDTMGLNLNTKVPIIDGEWAQYASKRTECYNQAPQTTSAYLSLLRSKHVGLIFWSLEPGVGTQTNNPQPIVDVPTSSWPTTASSYSQPTTFGSNYSCKYDANGNLLGQGAGSNVMAYFKKYGD
jgi:hypothetical protein